MESADIQKRLTENLQNIRDTDLQDCAFAVIVALPHHGGSHDIEEVAKAKEHRPEEVKRFYFGGENGEAYAEIGYPI